MIVKLIFQFLVFIFLAFLIALVVSFIWGISGAGKLLDLPERYRAKMFSKKWWLYVLIIAMFLTFMSFMYEKDRIGRNPQMGSFLADGLFFLIGGYLLTFLFKRHIAKEVEDKTKAEKSIYVARLSVIGFFLIGIYSFFIAGLIYFTGINVEWYMEPWILLIALLPVPRIALRRFESEKRGDRDINA